MSVDATLIYPNLYQGGRPPSGHILRTRGFACLVLCAMEHQPPVEHFPGIEVVHAPNNDNPYDAPLTREQLRDALRAARVVVGHLAAKRDVLVTCWQGRNRSGLVSALALHLHTGWDGSKCVDVVRGKRPRALTNPEFKSVLRKLAAKAA